jgi:uncharacterized protein (TIGR03437 family)
LFFPACAFSQTMVITSVVADFDSSQTTFSPGEAIVVTGTNFPVDLSPGVHYTVAVGGTAIPVDLEQISLPDTASGYMGAVFLIVALPPATPLGTVQVVVSYNGTAPYTGGPSKPFPITVREYSPVLSPTRPAYHLPSITPVTNASPALPGEQLEVYAEGLGAVSPPVHPPAITVSGMNIPITSAVVTNNLSLGYPATMIFTLPVNIPLGLDPLVLTIDGFSTTATLPVGNTPFQPAPAITSVNTSGSLAPAGIAQNTWIEIHGTNLAPTTTAASGVLWNSAPSFAQGQMPTSLNGISVTVNGKPAYVYFYCSAATDTSCATDQINVLTPLDSTTGNVAIVVTTASGPSAPYTALMQTVVPSFLLFSAKGYIAATHLDYSLIGPATLYPGSSTPSKPSETIVVYAVGLGLPSTPLTAGSQIQTGALPTLPSCKIGGNPAAVGFAGLISPGLYQLNITVPSNAGGGDNSIACVYNSAITPAGDLLTTSP